MLIKAKEKERSKLFTFIYYFVPTLLPTQLSPTAGEETFFRYTPFDGEGAPDVAEVTIVLTGYDGCGYLSELYILACCEGEF